MTWYRLFDLNTGRGRYFIPHWVHEDANEAVQRDLVARDHTEFTVVDAVYLLEDHPLVFDLPGMAMMTREYVTVDLDGFKIQIPCTDVGAFLEEALTAHTRDGDYIKLHGFLKCLCLPLHVRAEFIRQLSEKLDYAEAVAHVENERFNDAMANLPQAVVVDHASELPEATKAAKDEGRDVKLLIKRRPVKKGVAEG